VLTLGGLRNAAVNFGSVRIEVYSVRTVNNTMPA